jgi:hypothetical protein
VISPAWGACSSRRRGSVSSSSSRCKGR